MDGIPWQLLPIVGPFGFAFGIVITILMAIYRALQDSKLQTSEQVETQLRAKDDVIQLQRETIEHHRATHEDLMESARFQVDTLKSIRAIVERWE